MNRRKQIDKLHPYLEYAAGADTAYGKYNPDDFLQGKLHNHCGCVAYVIQKFYGGEIRVCKGHYWNKIGDLQYDGTMEPNDYYPMYSVSRKVPQRKKVNPRFVTFLKRVEWAIYG